MITIASVGKSIVESVTQNIVKRERNFREGENK